MAMSTGLDLARGFYEETVGPLIVRLEPDLEFSAALIGPGSEVLGFDDEVSTDHHWGPRVMVFCDDGDSERVAHTLSRALSHHLPPTYRGYPTNFTAPDPNDNGTQLLEPATNGPINHRVEIVGLGRWLSEYLGSAAGHGGCSGAGAVNGVFPLDEIDWLTLPQQKLLSLVSGGVFRDDRGRLGALRADLAWYPDDVWRYLLASVWTRIGQEEHLVGRAGQRGDEIGARIIAARLVRDLMRLGFLYERRYAPYAKWFGTAFAALACGPALEPLLRAVTESPDWRERDRALGRAYERVAAIHNSLALTRPMPERPVGFFGRPFHVIAIHGFAPALLETIHGSWLTPTMRRSPVGGIDLLSDNTDLLENPDYRGGVRALVSQTR
jgi:hypothetical protein